VSERLRKPSITGIVRRAFLFAGGELVNRGPDFFLLPLYGAFLAPDQFGVISLAATLTAVARTTLGLGLQTAAVKFFFDFEGEDRKRFYGTLWLTSIFGSGVLYLVVDAMAMGLGLELFRHIAYDPYLRMAFWTAWLGAAFVDVSREILKAAGLAGWYTGLTALQVIATTSLTVWLVVLDGQGAYGAILAHLLGTGIVAAVCGIALVRWVRWPGDRWRVMVPMLGFSVPMIPHFLAQWALSLSDRVILERWVPLEEIGVYSVGYTVGWALSLAKVAGAHAMIPLFGRHRHEGGVMREELTELVTSYFAVVAGLGVAVALFAPEIVSLLATEDYSQAVLVVPWIALAALVFALYNPSVQILHFVRSDSRSVAFATVTGGTVNIGANVLLVPYFGIWAAVGVTVFTYSLVTALVLWRQQRSYRMPWEFARMGPIFLVAVSITALGVHFGWNRGLPGVALRVVVLGAATAILAWLALRGRTPGEGKASATEDLRGSVGGLSNQSP
jgi:O-antigen/teichoic acid export membrane protein